MNIEKKNPLFKQIAKINKLIDFANKLLDEGDITLVNIHKTSTKRQKNTEKCCRNLNNT